MTKEEKAIMYFKDMRKKFCEDYLLGIPKDSVAYKATMAEKEFYDTAIEALEQEPCDDAISRQAALASIKNLYPDMPVVDIFNARRKWLEKYAPYFECENAVEQLPSVKPQEKTGHWLMTGEIDVYYDLPSYECSKCGQTSLEEGDYCPNCGARMFEPQERSEI